MNVKIYKYQPRLADEFYIMLPRGSQFLSVQIQNEALTLWFMVDTDEPAITHTFRIYGTGWEVKPGHGDLEHLGTVQDPNEFVWHIFEVKNGRL